ncbi:hypothetical protein DLAC_03865 [Tieghemostelium lacteum]|uniref:Uncharacterized protein n=1 Tax=Tieghemostelium lacteum TaxID=361077 RepID=A0A152A1F2_TIELA|nr:hypothetical protein DLAC_03865 [Tieghemostelium lacteum]|eukprot:KYQ99900.1 hypothetical protein DLAC_03865 [Tieghemostelium lacteum]
MAKKTIQTTKTISTTQQQPMMMENQGVIKLEQPRQNVLVEKLQTQVTVNESADHINIVEMPPEVMIEERKFEATELLNAEVNVPSAQVDIVQPAPRVFLEQQAPIIDVSQQAPRIEFIQREPLVNVNQPKAQVIINQQKPEVKIQSAKPIVSFLEPSAPNVQVIHQEPIIKVIRNEPIIRLTDFKGEPELIFQRQDNCILNYTPIAQPILTINKSKMMSTETLPSTTTTTILKKEVILEKNATPKKFEKRAEWLEENPKYSPKVSRVSN